MALSIRVGVLRREYKRHVRVALEKASRWNERMRSHMTLAKNFVLTSVLAAVPFMAAVPPRALLLWPASLSPFARYFTRLRAVCFHRLPNPSVDSRTQTLEIKVGIVFPSWIALPVANGFVAQDLDYRGIEAAFAISTTFNALSACRMDCTTGHCPQACWDERSSAVFINVSPEKCYDALAILRK